VTEQRRASPRLSPRLPSVLGVDLLLGGGPLPLKQAEARAPHCDEAAHQPLDPPHPRQEPRRGAGRLRAAPRRAQEVREDRGRAPLVQDADLRAVRRGVPVSGPSPTTYAAPARRGEARRPRHRAVTVNLGIQRGKARPWGSVSGRRRPC
jgi:hypothetical protein